MTFSHYDFEYVDIHTHFFPPQIFDAIWNFFEMPNDDGTQQGWVIKYKLSTEEIVQFLENKNVKAFTTYNYAHKKGVAEYINNWTINLIKTYKNTIPFGCVWPEDGNRVEYVGKLFDEHNFVGLKVQPLVQNFYPSDERMTPIYDLIVDKGKWYAIHAGTAPYSNKYLGYNTFVKLIEKYPNMNVIVAHMGAYEFKRFFSLLDKYENIYLDTAMVYIPRNIFEKWKKNIELPKPEVLLSYQDRILYGSDFPNIPYEYERSTKELFELGMPRSFYEDIFYKNAKKLFNIYLQ
ncbi:MAG: amidohydrolase family protein [Candidatus Hodarchaeota archaeon]